MQVVERNDREMRKRSSKRGDMRGTRRNNIRKEDEVYWKQEE